MRKRGFFKAVKDPAAAVLPISVVAVGAAAVAGVWAWRRFGPSTYARSRTMFGKARVYQVLDDAGVPVRLLEVGGVVQSGTYLEDRYTELVFEYLKRYEALFDYLPEAREVCVLGCGGYDYPEHLIANHPQVIVDAVEVDPAITALARRYFYLDRLIEEYDAEASGRLNLICDDALAHLKRPGKAYDAIVNDAFDGGTPPARLTTEGFARAVHARLVDGGLYLTNIVAALDGPGSSFLDEQLALLKDVFSSVEVLPCATESLTEEDNVIVCARR